MSTLASTVQKSISSCYRLRGRTQHLLLVWKYCWHFFVPFPFVDWADNAIECKADLVASVLRAVAFCFVGAKSNFVLKMGLCGRQGTCESEEYKQERGQFPKALSWVTCTCTHTHTLPLSPPGVVRCLADCDIHYVVFYTECQLRWWPFCHEKTH